MAPSQLKQLKTSLYENGLIGPQQFKKKRQGNAKTGASAKSRIQHNAILQEIRDSFNPFEVKASAKNVKFAVTTRDGSKAGGAPGFVRPGVTKSLGEERRRETLLKELNSRKKVGGIMDRRFGENDPTMTPEERAAERFARDSQRKFRKESMFNLEEEEEEEMQLTHMGQSLAFAAQDDFLKDDVDVSNNNVSEDESTLKRKHFLATRDQSDDVEEEEPERKKSKAEVMKEVISKSKFYKYERQKTKEDDDDLREELDKGLFNLLELMRGTNPPSKPELPKEDASVLMNPDRAALLHGNDRNQADKEYDQRLKQMLYDKRSKPTDRTMTEEEKAHKEAERLKVLEGERLRRMRGEESEPEVEIDDEGLEERSIPDDAKVFGLFQAVNEMHTRPEMEVEDEDDFILDEDLVDLDDNSSLSFTQSDEDDSSEQRDNSELGQLEDDDEMINGPIQSTDDTTGTDAPQTRVANGHLAFTYPCPESHQDFLKIVKHVANEELPLVVQRIRALYHPRLHSDNKARLGRFSAILVEHVAHLANQAEHSSFAILENLLRHIHSMAKGNSEIVAKAFRAHLRNLTAERPLSLSSGDLIILTGVWILFPTSDHFHPVVTPANLCLARYLGQSTVHGLSDLATGAYVATLSLQYQGLAKRYMPEFMNYCLNALRALAPSEPKGSMGPLLVRRPEKTLRLNGRVEHAARKPQFWNILSKGPSPNSAEKLKVNLIGVFVSLLDSAVDLWSTVSTFQAVFEPAQAILRHLSCACSKDIPSGLEEQIGTILDKLNRLLAQSRMSRRPLLLHDHRPLAIKTSIPKFEEDFNPGRHYDPYRDRAELSRLKAEHKRERKGAMRELRKDASFIAREALREKKEQDAAYEKKYKRLIAEIQGEEGRESKAYEKEKKLRQGKR